MENAVKIALVGNPNVGKSTVFNSLTGLKQHTGNWPGKTVTSSSGFFSVLEKNFEMFDLPGTYSLIAHSKEEEVTRDFICLEAYEMAIVVCDAVCLERNLNLALQVMDVSPCTIVAVNLVDEAQKKGIEIDFDALSKLLNTPVIGISARSGFHMDQLKETIYEMSLSPKEKNVTLLCQEHGKLATKKYLKKAEEIASQVVCFTNKDYQKKDRKIDKILTSKLTGIPIMVFLLALVFWLTISFSNIPSTYLFMFFHWLEEKLMLWFYAIHAPPFLTGIFISRSVQSADLGRFCDASTDGNLFPAIYVFRRFGLPTAHCI